MLIVSELKLLVAPQINQACSQKLSDIKIILPKVKEADPIGMVPTTSTAITLLYFNCLAIALMKKMNFTKNKFRVLHSGGNIGKSLLDVASVMVTGKKLQ